MDHRAEHENQIIQSMNWMIHWKDFTQKMNF